MTDQEKQSLEDLGYSVDVAIEGYDDFPTVYRVDGNGISMQISDSDEDSVQSLLNPPPPPDVNQEELASKRDQVRGNVVALLIRTDQWIIRATEDSVAISSTRKQRRAQLRTILTQIDTSTMDQLNNLQIPSIDNVP